MAARFRPPGLGRAFNPAMMPRMELEPLPETAKILHNMGRPLDNPASWNQDMRRLFGSLMFNVGWEAAKLARSAILGGRFGEAASISATLVEAKGITQALRNVRTSSPHPMREYGVLAHNIRAVVDPSGSEVVIGIPPGIVSKPRSGYPTQAPIALERLLRNFEEGYNFEITRKAQVAFLRKAAELEARSAAGPRIGGRPMAEAAVASKKAVAWRKLAALGLGLVDVAPRPVLGPAIALAVQSFRARGASEFLDRFADLWVGGRVSTGPVRGYSFAVM